MTNREAAEIMKAIIFILKNDDYSDEVEEAIHMAINALTAQEQLSNDSPELDSDSGDLISRQMAIDALDKEYRCTDQTDDWDGLKTALLIIENLPSAQPETHEERTETHARDLIDRQAAIDEEASK